MCIMYLFFCVFMDGFNTIFISDFLSKKSVLLNPVIYRVGGAATILAETILFIIKNLP